MDTARTSRGERGGHVRVYEVSYTKYLIFPMSALAASKSGDAGGFLEGDVYVRGETDIFAYLTSVLQKRIMILDGAMGTMIQKNSFTEEDFFVLCSRPGGILR